MLDKLGKAADRERKYGVRDSSFGALDPGFGFLWAWRIWAFMKMDSNILLFLFKMVK